MVFGVISGWSALVVLVLSTACSPPVRNQTSRPWFSGKTSKDLLSGNERPASATPYYSIERIGHTLEVGNTALGSGVTPVPLVERAPESFAWLVSARTEREGLEGGWGLEFAVNGEQCYRALIYSSGRFCVDRFYEDYPEFIHCVTLQPAVHLGRAENEMGLVVEGPRVTIYINGAKALHFEDERLRTGGLALAVAGADAKVRFLRSELETTSPILRR